jgi:O-antigen/teichoic acid export membrane protein
MTEINLGKNIFWTVLSRFGAQIVSVISNLLLARYLGSARFGEYAFISAIVLIGNALSTFGVDMVLIRKISAAQDYSDLPAALVIQLLISFVFIAGVFMISPFLPAGNSLRIYIFSLIPLSFFTVFTIALRGAQHMGSFSLLHFSVAVFQMIAIFILLIIKAEVVQLVALLLGVQFLGAVLGFILCITQLKDFPRSWHADWNRISLLLTSSTQLAVIGTLRLVYEKLAISMLPILTSVDVTGLFSASARVLDASKLGHMSALSAMFPEMARENSLERNFSKATKRNYVLLFIAAILFSFGLFFFAKPIIHLLFGEKFAASVEALQVMAWIIVPYFMVSYYSLAFVAVRMERPVLTALIMSLFLLAILLIWWSPRYGLRGVAGAILCAETFQSAFLWFQWRQYAISKQP